MRRVVALLAVVGSVAGAQQSRPTIEPGMNRAQVIEVLGRPNAERAAGAFVYLFYSNGCERECGMSDLVTLENDAVVDAIFRSPSRAYAGASSSPNGIVAARTAAGARRGTLTITAPASGAGMVTPVESTMQPTAVPVSSPAESPASYAAPDRTPVPIDPASRAEPSGQSYQGAPLSAADSARIARLRQQSDTLKGPPPEE